MKETYGHAVCVAAWELLQVKETHGHAVCVWVLGSCCK